MRGRGSPCVHIHLAFHCKSIGRFLSLAARVACDAIFSVAPGEGFAQTVLQCTGAVFQYPTRNYATCIDRSLRDWIFQRRPKILFGAKNAKHPSGTAHNVYRYITFVHRFQAASPVFPKNYLTSHSFSVIFGARRSGFFCPTRKAAPRSHSFYGTPARANLFHQMKEPASKAGPMARGLKLCRSSHRAPSPIPHLCRYTASTNCL